MKHVDLAGDLFMKALLFFYLKRLMKNSLRVFSWMNFGGYNFLNER